MSSVPLPFPFLLLSPTLLLALLTLATSVVIFFNFLFERPTIAIYVLRYFV
jgi:hypothetical protein